MYPSYYCDYFKKLNPGNLRWFNMFLLLSIVLTFRSPGSWDLCGIHHQILKLGFARSLLKNSLQRMIYSYRAAAVIGKRDNKAFSLKYSDQLNYNIIKCCLGSN